MAAATLAVIAIAAGSAYADDNPQPVNFTHNVTDAPAPVTSAVFGSGPTVHTGTAICSTPTQLTANVNTDCEGTGPHNETSITVNPTNPLNMIGGANDYQLAVNPGGHVSETVLSRAHVTFDGGKTWAEYPLADNSAYQATGDPSVAFDQAGNAYYATLGFRFVGPTNAQNPDVLVSHSSDGGKTWSRVRVAQGSGVATSVGDLLDKEYVTAWGNGNALVTFGDFRLGQKGALVSSQVYSSVTHDGGKTWSKPTLISPGLTAAFVAVPTSTANGSAVYAAFLNTNDLVTGRDTYYTVRLDPATGAPIGSPVAVGLVFDGVNDYPFDASGRQTYQDSQFRTWAAGNITVDPTNASHVAVVWSDMRNGPATSSDPYSTTTNSDVIVSQSFDAGATWSAPAAVALPGDQFMPWGAYDSTGKLRIGTFDRSVDPANHPYGYSVLTESTAGSLAFGAPNVVSTVNSDPTTGDRWFAATVNPAFPFATLFLGDYSNIAATADGHVLAYWTDMRNDATFAGRTGHGEDAYFAVAP
jgi:hypothetical protein